MTPQTLKQVQKMLKPEALDNGTVRTGPVRLAYVSVFEKSVGDDGDEGRYTATLLFPPGSDMAAIEEVAEAKAAEEFGTKWQQKGVKLPFRDGAEPKFAERPGYGPGVTWFRASSKNVQPGVVDRKRQPITDHDALYPGVWAIVTLKPYAWTDSRNGSGVSFGLQNVMKLADDDRLGGGGTSAAEDFGTIDSLDDVDALLAADDAQDMADDILA